MNEVVLELSINGHVYHWYAYNFFLIAAGLAIILVVLISRLVDSNIHAGMTAEEAWAEYRKTGEAIETFEEFKRRWERP